MYIECELPFRGTIQKCFIRQELPKALCAPPTPYLVGRFPTEDGLVAPGMSCSYTVKFTPDSLADFQDELKVHTYVCRVLGV